MPHLLVPDGKSALGFLVVLGERLQLLNRMVLQDRGKEFHILFRVLVAGLHTIQQFSHMDCFARKAYVDLGVVG